MVSILRRTTYIVNDIQKSITFYKDVIGLNLLWESETVLNGGLPIGKAGDKAKFVAFNGDDPVVGMVAFLQIMDKDFSTSELSRLQNGSSILVLVVDSCDDTYKKILSFGGRVHKAPFKNSITGRDKKKILMKSMFAWDPDSIFLEINQRL